MPWSGQERPLFPYCLAGFQHKKTTHTKGTVPEDAAGLNNCATNLVIFWHVLKDLAPRGQGIK